MAPFNSTLRRTNRLNQKLEQQRAKQASKKEADRDLSLTDDLAYKTSRWTRYLYKQERELQPGLRKAEHEGRERQQSYGAFQRELFSRVYKPSTPALDEHAQGAEWAAKLHEQCNACPEFEQLQQRCAGDEQWSGMATASMSRKLAAAIEPQKSNQDVERLRQQVEALQEMAQEGVPCDEQLQDAMNALQDAQESSEAMAAGMDGARIRQAIREAAEEAAKEVNDQQQAMSALCYGDQPGTPGNVDPAQRRQLAEQLRNNSKLKRIAEQAGRLRRIAAQKQRSKSSHARSEVTDVDLGADIDRVLLTELALLNDPDLEALFFAKLSDRQLQQYKLAGKEREGRGPIVCCIDVSGSMSDNDHWPETWAKAVALALLEVARRQRRSMAIVLFDCVVQGTYYFRANEPIDVDRLLEMASYFSGGGTTFDAPLRTAIDVITNEPCMRKSDVVFITDGCASISDELVTRWQQLRREHECSMYTVLCNPRYRAEQVEAISNEVYRLQDLVQNEDKFNDKVLAI